MKTAPWMWGILWIRNEWIVLTALVKYRTYYKLQQTTRWILFTSAEWSVQENVIIGVFTHSYSDLYFGITFWDMVHITKCGLICHRCRWTKVLLILHATVLNTTHGKNWCYKMQNVEKKHCKTQYCYIQCHQAVLWEQSTVLSNWW